MASPVRAAGKRLTVAVALAIFAAWTIVLRSCWRPRKRWSGRDRRSRKPRPVSLASLGSDFDELGLPLRWRDPSGDAVPVVGLQSLSEFVNGPAEIFLLV